MKNKKNKFVQGLMSEQWINQHLHRAILDYNNS